MYRFLRGRSSRRKIYKVRLALFLSAKVDFWILRKSYRGPVYTNPLWHDFYRLKATSVDYWRFVLSQLFELSTDVLRLFARYVKVFSRKTNFYISMHKLSGRFLSTIRHLCILWCSSSISTEPAFRPIKTETTPLQPGRPSGFRPKRNM